MNEERRAALGTAVMQVFNGMGDACNLMLEEAKEREIIYPIHGSQLADPPGGVGDLWKVRTECADGYARNFDEKRKTLDFIGEQLIREETPDVDTF